MDSTANLTKMKLISVNFDRSLSKLKNLIDNPRVGSDSKTTPEVSESMSKLTDAIDRVDQEVKALKSALQGLESISALKSRIQAAFERKEENPVTTVEAPIVEHSTPLKIPSVIEPFEDFPNSPTLEQLGLSGPTLSIVGRRAGYDSSASMSDGEFDNSFYQKSPMCVNDNSFSSDVSVPNFRILNSSPQTSNTETGKSRPKSSHNLKQVTTLVDFPTSEDSSMMAIDEDQPDNSNPRKRVHFVESDENKLIN